MNAATAWSVSLIGMSGTLVEVEATIGAGLPRTVLVGLPDAALHEARDRCKAAVNAAPGLGWPSQLVTINLTPASFPKSGTHFDLAIVAAVLGAAGVVPTERLADAVLIGELGLFGRVRPVRGVLSALLAAKQAGMTTAIVPARQLREARLVTGLTLWAVDSLAELIEVLHGRPVAEPVFSESECAADAEQQPDLRDVVGQPQSRYALEVAAAGGHHLFLHGPPGVGKTMLAKCLPGLLPELDADAALEVSALASLAGQEVTGLVRRPPFSDPHHNTTMAALIGGGARLARPGAISLAHRGVLFLDEAPEFSPRLIDALRTPMESGWITVARSGGVARYPARFQLVLAANPCPCGMSGVGGACKCTSLTVRRYNERLSGPILDRIDIHDHLQPIRQAFLRASLDEPEPTAVVAARVAAARDRQRARLAKHGWATNAEVPGRALRKELPPVKGLNRVDAAVQRGRLSARGVDKVLRLAWTLCDLAGRDRVEEQDVLAALGLNQADWLAVAS